MHMAMPIYESAEDYLEAILVIHERKGIVHLKRKESNHG